MNKQFTGTIIDVSVLPVIPSAVCFTAIDGENMIEFFAIDDISLIKPAQRVTLTFCDEEVTCFTPDENKHICHPVDNIHLADRFEETCDISLGGV